MNQVLVFFIGHVSDNNQLVHLSLIRWSDYNKTEELLTFIRPENPINENDCTYLSINNLRLKRVPAFHEIAKRIVEIAENQTIIHYGQAKAWSLVLDNFSALSYPFSAYLLDINEVIKNIPSLNSHANIGELSAAFNIPYNTSFNPLLAQQNLRQVWNKYITYKSDEKIIPLSWYTIMPKESGLIVLTSEGKIIEVLPSKNLYLTAEKLSTYYQSNSYTLSYQINQSFTLTTLIYWDTLFKKHPKVYSKKKHIAALLFNTSSNEYHIEEITPHIKPLLSFSALDEGLSHLHAFRRGNNKETPIYQLPHSHFLILVQGRYSEEKAFIYCKDQQIKGYGYYNYWLQINTPEKIKDRYIPLTEIPEIYSAIYFAILYNQYEEIVIL